MRVRNAAYQIDRPGDMFWLAAVSRGLRRHLAPGTFPLRFSIVDASPHECTIEATILEFADNDHYAERFADIELFELRKKAIPARPFVAVQVIPTGVRCEFGGYAGDAGPVTNLLASTVDFLVTHPNAVNASDLNEMAANALYVEGKSLDDFLLGHVGLVDACSNRIGTFVDPTGLAQLDHVINAFNAARAVRGVDCRIDTVLDEEAGVEIEWSRAGCAVGTIKHPDAVLRSVELLISHGADAIGGVSVIQV